MTNLTAIEIKAYVPARDYELSKRFYADLGFEIVWFDANLAYMKHGKTRFLLQNFYDETHAANYMMHLLVEDVDAWWRHVEARGVPAKYGVHTEPPSDKPPLVKLGPARFRARRSDRRALARRADHLRAHPN